jgi:PAS domain S-box-containing protein
LSVSESHADAWNLRELSAFGPLFTRVLSSNRALRLTAAEVQALGEIPLKDAADKRAEALPPMRGCLAVPLLGRNGKNIGLLQLSDKYEGEFSQQDEYVAMEMARLAAVAMENVQLIEEVNQLNNSLEKKVAERTKALTRQEALFRALAQQAPQVVWTTDSDGRLTYVNHAWFDLMGGEFENWSGIQWHAAVHPEDLPGSKANWMQAKITSQPFAGVRRLLTKSGRVHTMSYRASPVFDAKGAVSFWVGIDADITEMKAIEAELRLSNQELEAFSYSVSHDLRSPLNTIDGFSRLLAKQINAESGDKATHYLSRIHAGVSQMGQLIEDILSLAQVSRVQLRHELIDLSAMAAKSVEALRVRDPEREVSVTIADHLQIYGDSRLVNVVMENLLGNAWKFSSQSADAAIFVGQTADPAGLGSFFVRDNGAGFDMAYADKLFRAFQRLHTAAEFPGTGIGLATVKRIVARHGGHVWPESTPGLGATFFFTLPRSPAGV